MSGRNEHLISAEEVMRRVRVKLGLPHAGSTPTLSAQEGINGQGPLLSAAAQRDFQRKGEYALGDLLRYDDAEFVTNVYRAVLVREPDGGAGGYLRELRAGSISKVEVIGAIRWSPEGLSRSVHVDGLLIPYKLQVWRRLPVVGRVLGWGLDAIRLPTLLRRLETQLGHVSGDAQAMHEALGRVSATNSERIVSLEKAVTALPSMEAIEDLQSRMDAQAERISAEIEVMKTSRGPAVGESLRKDLDQLYADFEEQFRGPEEQIRQRLEPYLKFVSDLGVGTPDTPVVDLGCGRGEWLQMLRDRGLTASGVDLNEVFVQTCQAKGLNVAAQDAIAMLRSLPARSVGLVTSFHLVEHLPFEVMIDLFDEALRVLVPGGGMIIETPNPENALVAQWAFYMDPTHRNPLPPEMLRWMVNSRGFVQSDIVRLFEARTPTALEAVPAEMAGAATINALAEPTRASLDYAIVARKSVSAL
ncbi:methyltransferase domain-containing protein [Lysobacter sp. LF1]|uniref:Methyltransferase domain-containing protein n=1 Tax=Lysobacter stagni TaxID=3045172 RepID=A0ABT6XF11_9GAMM|nr:methyltransferase domain-containing protein [Lysobacter sp. LF1]MDI9238731.1 methyltransferase domain-containing protein [Lysobacter sp. LF1]